MKKSILMGFFALFTISGSAQLKVQSKKLIKKDNILFLKENGTDYKVDTKTITVKLKDGEILDEKSFIVERQNKLGYIDITVPEGKNIDEYAKVLDESGIFELVEYNSIGEFCSITPNDYFYSYQWNLQRIKVDKAWKYTMGDSIVKIAIIDTGVDYNHRDIGYGSDGYRNIIENSIWNTNFSDSHGTEVAGIIGAKTNNTWGVAGISGGNGQSGVTMIPYYVGSNGTPNSSIIDDAIIDATDKGAKVIQLSLGVAYSTAIVNAINYAYNNGASIVCAAGNITSNSTNTNVTFPAYLDNVIAVGATTIQNYRRDSSRYGNGLDIMAPGSALYSTQNNNGYDFVSGTSVAAPHVSGVIALMLSINPSITPETIFTTLKNTAYKISLYNYDSTGWNEEVGYGLIDAYAAISAIVPMEIIGTEVICDSALYYVGCLPSGNTVQWELDNEYYNDSEYLFRTDYPSGNQCMIIRDNHLALNGTLTARIYDDEGILIRTLTKIVRTRTKAEFLLDVESTWPPVITSATVSEDNPAKVPSGTLVKMRSTRFQGMNITSAGACTYLMHNGDSVKLRTTGIAYLYCSNNNNCDQFTLCFYTSRKPLNPILNDSVIVRDPIIEDPIITNEEGKILVSLNQIISDNDNLGSEYVTKPLADDISWNISVYRYSDGRRILNKTFHGSHGKVSTNGWASGLYIVRIICSHQTFSQKFSL